MDLESRLQWLDSIGGEWSRSQNLDELKGWLTSWLEPRRPKTLLEIGTRTGSNLYLMAGALQPGGTAHAVDKSVEFQPQRRAVEAQLAKEGIACQIRDSTNSTSLEVGQEYDCVYIDGGHKYGDALTDWKKAMLLLAPGGCIGFHDTCHWPKTDRTECSAFWADALKFLDPQRVGLWESDKMLGTSKNLMGIGAVAFRERLLFMVNGGLGDAAEMTRIMLVAAKLGYIVHVLVIHGLAGEMGNIWAQIPWVTQVNRETAAKLKYKAILCPTTSEALRQRAEGLKADIVTNGGVVKSPTGNIIEDWQNLLVAIGHPIEEVRGLMPRSPLAYLLPPALDRNLTMVAPGVGSALGYINKGQAKDKRYPRWADTIRYLPRPLVIVGNEQAREPWMDEFKDDKEIQNMVGQSPHAADLLPLLAHTRALYAPDNGLGHFAGLFGVQVISIFNGATDAARFCPPEAMVVKGTNENIRPGMLAGMLHYVINPECLQPAGLVTGGLLSVVITTHNEGDEVLMTVEDVMKNAGCPTEVIVVDDASTDGSCDSLPAQVKLIRNKERQGVAPARNQGAAAATGEAFMFLDAHMRVTPGTPAKMMLAALETKAIIVPGVAPLYSPKRGAVWTCGWEFRGGRLRSRWLGEPKEGVQAIDCFVAPGWVITRREWDKLGPWPSSLRQWGSTEVCKSLQAYMTKTPILTMKTAVLWHRFRSRFPYHTSPVAIMENAYVVSNVLFGNEVFNSMILPAMKKVVWGENYEKLLASEGLQKDVADFAKRRVVDPAEFLHHYFPQGLPEEKAEIPEVRPIAGAPPPPDVTQLPFFDSPACRAGSNCAPCRQDPGFRKAISAIYGLTPDYPCPHGIEASFAHLQAEAVKAGKPLFFTTPHCTSKLHCKACRTDENFRKSLSGAFYTGAEQFECLPHGLVPDNFKDGKFPSLVQEALNLAQSAAKVVAGAVQGEPVIVPEEELKRRMDICQGTGNTKACDIYDAGRGRCRKCGCKMDIKAACAQLHCPIGKW